MPDLHREPDTLQRQAAAAVSGALAFPATLGFLQVALFRPLRIHATIMGVSTAAGLPAGWPLSISRT